VPSGAARKAIFAALVLVCLGIAAVAIAAGVRGNAGAETASPGADRILAGARADHEPMVLYRTLSGVKAGDAGPIDVAPLGRPADAKHTGLRCNRVYYAAGHGLCLARGGGFAAGYQVRIFGSDLHVTKTIDVTGVPSRARVSADGRYGATTLFVTGHSYAAAGTFSTQATLFDLARGEKLGDLEQFTVYKDDRQVTAVDVNFWGITFDPTNSDTFYATLATSGKTYLLKGSVSERTAKVLHENVECPSISPDGTRIAYKRRTGSSDEPWRLTVLDLATMRETPLAETRSVDDQAEWLDDGHVVYGRAGAVWSVPADGTGQPQRFVAEADSPSVMRN
jgi:hypothetical protein